MANHEIIGAGQDTARPAPKTILDACCGSRMFWFDRADPRALFLDKRRETWKIDKGTPGTIGRSPIVVDPDILSDFSALPFDDNSFALVVFDPPHIQRTEAKGLLTRKYGVLNGNWREMIRRGFSECFRVLVPHGTLIFKWSESEVLVSDVLTLTQEKPLFGHKSGKSSGTHWIVFTKAEDRTSCAPGSPAQNTMEICHTAPNNRMASATHIAPCTNPMCKCGLQMYWDTTNERFACECGATSPC